MRKAEVQVHTQKILEDRKEQVFTKGEDSFSMKCDQKSLAGAVSQRACVFCGSRVVLYPIADAVHLIHGPIGCAAYTWDIRGSVSSGPELHRLSFSTDLKERNIIYGAEDKLYEALNTLITQYEPKAAFIYATCIVGIIGDDVDAVCRRVESERGIPVVPVHSEGFKGTKKDGYKAACEALFSLMERHRNMAEAKGTLELAKKASRPSINIMGEFNLAGEAWMIQEYYKTMGIDIVSVMTGDGRVNDISRAYTASLNVVQCSGSMVSLAEMMKREYGIPYIRVSYFGIEDTAQALYDVAEFFGSGTYMERAEDLVHREIGEIYPRIRAYKAKLKGKKAAIYVGGAFKAFSLIKALHMLGMEIAVVGSQTGNAQDYKELQDVCEPGTVIVDDSNPLELSTFILEKDVDLFIGGVKERPMALKLGVAFCDHNHERKIPLAGFEGMVNFADEVYSSAMSPVWKFAKRNSVPVRELEEVVV